VLDGSDNFATRLGVNRAAVRARVPLVFGAAIRLEGQMGVFRNDGSGPCYHCLYDDEDEWLGNCQGNGVLAPVPGVIGTLMAVEALKLLAGVPSGLVNRMLLWDAKHGDWQSIGLAFRPGCPDCQRTR
jgi:adenylyltransferase/sulfurtransferase